MNKQPEKTAKTRQKIIDAFWTVSKSRGLNSVTISEVSKKANINRSTFYVYFSDIKDLLYEEEQKIIEDLRTKIFDILLKNDFADFATVSSIIIDVFGKYDDKLFLILGKNGDPFFLDFVRKEAATYFSQIFKESAKNPYQDYIIAYLTSAFAGMLQFWQENGKKLPLIELSEISHCMATRGITGIKEKFE